LSRIVGLVAVLALSACGFQLRGEAAMGLKSLHVSTAAPSMVAVEVRRQVTASSTRLAPSAKEGEAHLRILSESTDKTIQTLTGAGQVFDYRLRLKVGFQVTDAGEKPVVPPAEIELWRIISYSATAPLAKEAEEQLLFADMRSEAATRILRRIAVVRAAAPQQ
jgi:LPS-assembly lipoprotein